MPLKIDLSDYGVNSISNLANIAGSMHGEVKPNAGIRDRAMIGDVGANRVGGPFGSKGAEGTTGAAKYLTDPNQFSTWRPTEAAAYKNATGMRDAVLAVGRDPAAFDRLSPQMQQNMLASLAAARGVYGTGELRGISGGSTFYSVIDILSPGRTAEHEARGARSGVNVGGNTFYGNDPEMSAKVAQGIKDYDYGGAISTLANNLPQTLATPYRNFQPDLFKPQGQGFNPDSPTNPGVPDASGYGIGDPNFGGGVEALGYDTVRNPANPVAGAPQPPGRPSDADLDLRGPLDKASDAITQGVEGAGNAALGVVQGAAGAIQNAGDAAAKGVGNLLQGFVGSSGSAPQPAPGSTDFSNADVSSGVGNGSLNPVLAPYQPAPGATDFSSANVSGSVQNGVLNPLLQGLTSQPAPTVPAPATTPTIPAGTPEQQVAAIYQQVLGRQGDPGEVGYWAQLLRTGRNDLNGIVATFQNSPEAQVRGISPQGMAPTIAAPQPSPTVAAPSANPTVAPPAAISSLPPNATNEQRIIHEYETVNGRTPGAEEVGYWNEMMRRGLSVADFDTQVRNSPEARARQNAFPSQNAQTISAPDAGPTMAPQGLSVLAPSQEAPTIGAPTATPTIPAGPPEQQVAAAYQNVLGRAGGPDEIGYWSQLLRSGQNDIGSIVARFQASPEGQARGATGLSPLIAAQTAPTIAPPAATQGLSVMNIPTAPPASAPASVPTISAGSPAQIVNEIYQAELGRPAEAGAIAYGSAVLSSGKLTAADFAQQVRNSPEAMARRNSFPSQDAPTISAPAASAPVENFGMTPTIGAPAATPTISPTLAPTIAPTQVPTIAAPPAVQATSPSSISPYGFSMSNVSTGFGAIPQTFGSYYGPSGGSTTNLGLDLPAAASDPVSDFNFSGANVGGFDVNAPGIGAAPQVPAEGFAMQQGSGYNPQASQNAYLDSQIKNANAANSALDAFNAGITPVGQAPLRAGQFVSSTGDPGLYQNASDYNIQTMVLNQQALAQKPAAVIAAKPVAVPKVAQGAFAPAPFAGRW